MRPLKDVMLPNADNELYVFYDFGTTQNEWYSDTAKIHVISSAYNRFVRCVSSWKMLVKIVNGAAGGGTLFEMIL